MAKVVMDNLIKNGKIVRGWLGVSIQPVTPDLAKQFGLKNEKGVLISDVMSGSPAEQAGLQTGDVIIEFNGKEVNDPADLKNMVANISPGKTAPVKYIRGGETKTVQVTMRELPDKVQLSAKADNHLKGVTVQSITPEIRAALKIPARVNGVVVSDVAEESPASEVLTKGDIIIEINKKRISGIKDYEAVVSKIKAEQKILLLVLRNGAMVYLTF